MFEVNAGALLRACRDILLLRTMGGMGRSVKGRNRSRTAGLDGSADQPLGFPAGRAAEIAWRPRMPPGGRLW